MSEFTTIITQVPETFYNEVNYVILPKVKLRKEKND